MHNYVSACNIAAQLGWSDAHGYPTRLFAAGKVLPYCEQQNLRKLDRLHVYPGGKFGLVPQLYAWPGRSYHVLVPQRSGKAAFHDIVSGSATVTFAGVILCL